MVWLWFTTTIICSNIFLPLWNWRIKADNFIHRVQIYSYLYANLNTETFTFVSVTKVKLSLHLLLRKNWEWYFSLWILNNNIDASSEWLVSHQYKNADGEADKHKCTWFYNCEKPVLIIDFIYINVKFKFSQRKHFLNKRQGIERKTK